MAGGGRYGNSGGPQTSLTGLLAGDARAATRRSCRQDRRRRAGRWDSTAALCERAGSAVRELNTDLSGLVSLEGMARQLLRSEALASSQIEGLSISHRRLAEAELEDGQGHHRAQEILGTIRALERAMDIGTELRDLDIDAIVEIHRELAIVPPLTGSPVRSARRQLDRRQCSPRRRIRRPPLQGGATAPPRSLPVHEPR